MNWQNSKILENIKKKLDAFVEKPFFLLGDYTRDFEKNFAKYSQVAHCKTVANGTIALQLIIRSLNLKKGSKILVTSFCPIPTIMAILQEGFVPKFVDIDKCTLNISAEMLKNAIDKECTAVIAVHIFGKMCPMDELSILCLENDLALIEDACQAIGASHPNYKIGEFSKAAAMSFYPTKNLGSWGDGGAVLTNDLEIAHQISCMRNYGLNESFESEMLGGNYRMDDFQALVLSEKMIFLNEEKQLRNSIYNTYRDLLPEGLFQSLQDFEHQNHHVISYVLDRGMDRNDVRILFKKFNVKNIFHYEHPVFEFKALQRFSAKNVVNTLDICERIINLPIQKKNNEFYEKLVDLLKK